MIAKQSGTILLTGATASLRGGASFATLGEYLRTPVVADCNLEELRNLDCLAMCAFAAFYAQSSLWFITFPLCPTAVGKFALRALGQSLAREFHPQGIHVAHIIVDGQIKSERYSVVSRQTFYLGKICSYVQPGSQAFNGSFGPKHGLSGHVPT
jgi:NAD(P)-dependent dehydrogenase (short-subunit alcohol dehydrogenase family)